MRQKTNRHIVITRVFYLLLTFCTLYGQVKNDQDISKKGTTAAQFLKISIGGRGSAMGSATVALCSDLTSSYWNPAGLANVEGIQVYFENNEWFVGTSLQYGAVGFANSRFGTFSLSLTSLTTPYDIVRTVETPKGTGDKFNSQDIAIALSFAKRLTDRLALGGSIKNIRQRIWHSTGQTMATDFGVQYKTPIRNILLGASISNFGNDFSLMGRDMNISVDPDPYNQGNVEFVNAEYQTDAFPLPLFFRVGIGGYLVKTSSVNAMFSVDAVHPNDNYEYLNLGVEMVFNKSIYLRAGYPSLGKGGSIEGPTFGVGIDYQVFRSSAFFKLEYSTADFGPLGIIQRLSVGYQF
jgi:hypothetical protein